MRDRYPDVSQDLGAFRPCVPEIGKLPNTLLHSPWEARPIELADAGIPFEVVPGVSSVVAGPNYAGIPITHRDHCSSFTVITGHEDSEKDRNSMPRTLRLRRRTLRVRPSMRRFSSAEA
jgi:hypothetical protein